MSTFQWCGTQQRSDKKRLLVVFEPRKEKCKEILTIIAKNNKKMHELSYEREREELDHQELLIRYSLLIRHFFNFGNVDRYIFEKHTRIYFFEKLTELTELIRRMLILYAVYKFMHDNKRIFFLNGRQRKRLLSSANSKMAVVFRAVAYENPVMYSLLPTSQKCNNKHLKIRVFITFQFNFFCIFILL